MAKGMTINILSVGLVLLAVVVIYAFFHPFSQPHAAEYAKTDIYVMKNAIESSKAYMEASLDFSVYQALYDVAKKGGQGDSASATYANRLEPSIPCSKTGDRIGGGEDEVIGCVPGKFGCSSEDGMVNFINDGYGVGLLQLLLKDLKYSIAVDCKFGKETLGRLKEFQKKSGITETGFVDSATVAKLKAAFAYDNCGDYFYGCSSTFAAFWSAGLDEEGLKNNLKTAIIKNMNSYTSGGYRFIDLPAVSLPTYDAQNVELTETIGGFAVSLAGENIRISKSYDKEEVVNLESPSRIGKIYNIDAFGMFRKAKSVADYLNGRMCEQMNSENKKEDGFDIKIEVTKTTSPSCKATAKVSVAQENAKKFPVSAGTGVSFETINITFMVNVGGGVIAPQPPQPSAATAGKILLLGDSITVGYSPFFVKNPPSQAVVTTRAKVGWQTTDMLTELQSIDVSTYDTLIVLGGVNDIASGATSTRVEQRLKAIDDYAKGKGKRAVHVTILPWRDYSTWTTNKQKTTEDVNAWLKATYGSSVIDAYAMMNDGTGRLKAEYRGSRLPDGYLHPGNGYDDLAVLIAQNLPPPSTPQQV